MSTACANLRCMRVCGSARSQVQERWSNLIPKACRSLRSCSRKSSDLASVRIAIHPSLGMHCPGRCPQVVRPTSRKVDVGRFSRDNLMGPSSAGSTPSRPSERRPQPTPQPPPSTSTLSTRRALRPQRWSRQANASSMRSESPPELHGTPPRWEPT